MAETLPYLYFLPKKADILIIGSFPCFNGIDYGNWFYSGSGKNHFWKLMSDLFLMPAETRKEKERLCTAHGIALTDVALRIERKKGNCSDSNLVILEYNRKGLETCLNSGIQRIFFTSRFVEKQFMKLFPQTKTRTMLLLSPSPAANRHIGGLPEYKEMFRRKLVSSPYEYRLIKYRESLKIKT